MSLRPSVNTKDVTRFNIEAEQEGQLQLTNVTDDWTIGVEVGSYIKYELLFNSVNPAQLAVGATSTHDITEITSDDISFVIGWEGTGSQVEGFGNPITFSREGYEILIGGVAHPLATTNTSYLENELKLNSSGNLRYASNESSFIINDDFYHDIHMHQHTYNATYDRTTGWLLFLEIDHFQPDGSDYGLFRFNVVEFGNREFPQDTDSMISEPSETSQSEETPGHVPAYLIIGLIPLISTAQRRRE